VQRQSADGILATLGYMGQHGLHQPLRTSDANTVLPTETADGLLWPVPRNRHPYKPKCRRHQCTGMDFVKHVRGVELSLAWEHKVLRLGGSYTFSRSIDDSSSSVAATNFNNSVLGSFIFGPAVARGLSDFDVRQNLVMNATWLLPHFHSASSLARWAANGWQLGGNPS
jgi:hypothetical protein